MSSSTECQLTLFSQSNYDDESTITLLKETFPTGLISSSIEDVGIHLNNHRSMVLLFSCEQLTESIRLYDQLLVNLPSSKTLNHKVIFLVNKREENEAYNAYASGMADDYLVSKPCYEKKRLISMIRHLFIELGQVQYSTAYAYIEQQQYPGYNRKKQAADKFTDVMRQAAQKTEALKAEINQGNFSPEKLKINLSAISEQFKQYQSDEQKSAQVQLIIELIGLSESCLNHFFSHSTKDKPGKIKITKQHKILLVEDDPWSAKVVCRILSQDAFKVDLVANGRSAIQHIESTRYDLILMDVGLPDSDGAVLISQLRKNQGKNKETPVIMLTGAKDEGTIKRCAANKIQGYLVKPIAKDYLLEKLNDVLGVTP